MSNKSRSQKQDGGAGALLMNSNDETDDNLCKMCQKVNDKLVECEKCERWQCLSCADLSNKQCDVLRSAREKMHWYCQGCNKEPGSAVKTAELIKTKCQQYVAELLDQIELKIHEKFDKKKERDH